MLDSILNINIDLIEILIISMLPITELRFSIPYYFSRRTFVAKGFYCFNYWQYTNWHVNYNDNRTNYEFFKKNYYFRRIINYIINRTKNKSKMIEIYKFLGLVLFIGIPAPFTGVWTGSLAAYLLSFEKKKSHLGIIIGVMISATIVLIITLFVKELISLIFDFLKKYRI